MMSIKQALLAAYDRLKNSTETANLDAELLLSFVLKKTRTYLFTYPEKLLSENEYAQFQELIHAREKGWPVAYLISRKEFWSLSLKVSLATLIPRTETELLVERVLEHVSDITMPKILELGTGSGAISLAIAKERPDANIIAIDQSLEALHIAQANARHFNLKNITFFASDWFSAITPKPQFHLIVSNPPYLSVQDPHLTSLSYEPKTALISAKEGLADLEKIISCSQSYLLPDGWLCVEHGFDQKEKVQALFLKSHWQNIQTHHDLQNHPRITEGRRP